MNYLKLNNAYLKSFKCMPTVYISSYLSKVIIKLIKEAQ